MKHYVFLGTSEVNNPMRSDEFSEAALEFFYSADSIFRFGDKRAGIAYLDNAIYYASGLTQAEREYFLVMRTIWARAMAPDYRPRNYSHDADVFPLWLKYSLACEAGNDAEALRFAWMYLQYCSAGPYAYQRALATLVEAATQAEEAATQAEEAATQAEEAATQAEEAATAHHAAEMYVSHHHLLQSARQCAQTPVSSGSPEAATLSDVEEMEFYPPYEVALKQLEDNPAPVWAQILEMTLRQPAESGGRRHEKVAVALLRYYARAGDAGSCTQLQARFPRLNSDAAG